VPVANAGGNVLKSSFAASWSPVAGAADYIIDVSSNNFAAYEDGYHDKPVNAASCNVTLTTGKASYQYRVRARNGSD
ncbi:MAG: 1,4-beta-xylanase, partial [Candidatus Nephrothrix sp. EaCA]